MSPSSLEEQVENALARLDTGRKIRLLTGSGFWRTHAEPAVGLRAMVLSDGPAGVRGERFDERDPSAVLPCPTAVAASWDPGLARRLGRLLAAEARRKGVDVVLGPTVNLHRTPYAGRNFECYSEDPLLSGEMGAATVAGLQSAGVAATVKHYVGNDFETDRFTVDVRIGERALREVYAAPFEHIVRTAAPWALMAAYNSVNGTTMTESPLLDEPLRGEWGFDGLVVSDWFAARSTEGAALGSLDLAMPGPLGPWGDALAAAVEAGRVPLKAVDAKVRNLLRLAARVGALGTLGDPEENTPPSHETDKTHETNETHETHETHGGTHQPEDERALLRAAATSGAVLVRNHDALLPLPAERLRRIAVLGPNAATARVQGGGSATVHPRHTVSPLDGLRAALGDTVEVTHAPGVRTRPRLPALDHRHATDPVTGEPGFRVRFHAPDGSLVLDELRLSARLLWLSDATVQQACTVEVEADVRMPGGGPHRIGVAGSGRFLLTADDTVLVDEDIAKDDPLSGILHPPERSTTHHLAPDRPVRLRLRHEFPTGALVVGFLLGVEAPDTPADEELRRAVALAADADAAVVEVGTNEQLESEGVDRTTLALPGAQDELVRRVAAANPRTVVVVNAGAPVLLPWRSEVGAVLLTWFPGQEFGHALADILLGRSEPGGRLPMTWPADETSPALRPTTPAEGVVTYGDDLDVGYRAWAAGGHRPAYPFGHGLGYTTWEYVAVSAPADVPADGDAVVRVTLRNTGPRHGRHTVQAYLRREASAVARPSLWLAAFTTAEAAPGAETTVSLRLPPRAFAHWAEGWQIEPGGFTLLIGDSAEDHAIRTTMHVG
ncbi:glycoside hydrolase family 3 C-terminal domain-containing protein [Streptomycetaceae bacterium NBC_01309]